MIYKYRRDLSERENRSLKLFLEREEAAKRWYTLVGAGADTGTLALADNDYKAACAAYEDAQKRP